MHHYSSLLTVDPSTVKSYNREFEKAEFFVPTRGKVKDMGRCPSHKQIICRLLGKGYTYQQISVMTGHSEASIERYAGSFGKVIALANRGTHIDDIRLI